MANKRITSNVAITYDQVLSTDVLLVGKTSVDRKITLPETKKYVLLNRTIGGSGANDIVTVSGSQALTDKELIMPSINGSVCLAQGSDLNKLLNIDTTQPLLNLLAGLTVSSTYLNRTSGLTTNAQSQLNNKISRYGVLLPVVYKYYKIQEILIGTSMTVTFSELLAFCSLSAENYRVDGHGMVILVWNVNVGTLTRTRIPAAEVQYTCTIDGSNVNISTVTVSSLLNGKTYQVNILFALNSYSGGV